MHPIDLYLVAKKRLDAGDKKGAAQRLSQALGSEETTPVIENAVEALIDPNTRAHQVTLGLLSHEANKARKSNE